MTAPQGNPVQKWNKEWNKGGAATLRTPGGEMRHAGLGMNHLFHTRWRDRP
jgi:hypothetical protein